MAYYCNVWVSAPSIYLDRWDGLQKQVGKLLGPVLTVSLNLLSYLQNEATVSLFKGITLKTLISTGCIGFFFLSSATTAAVITLHYRIGEKNRS